MWGRFGRLTGANNYVTKVTFCSELIRRALVIHGQSQIYWQFICQQYHCITPERSNMIFVVITVDVTMWTYCSFRITNVFLPRQPLHHTRARNTCCHDNDQCFLIQLAPPGYIYTLYTRRTTGGLNSSPTHGEFCTRKIKRNVDNSSFSKKEMSSGFLRRLDV